MNKKELVQEVAKKTQMSQKACANVVDAVFETIAETLEKKDKVQFIGFGTFETRERAARMGKNPHSGEQMEIAASTVPAFKAGKGLKERINQA